MNAKIIGIENRIELSTKSETLMAVLQLPDGTELRAAISTDTAAYIIQNTMTPEPAQQVRQPAPRAPSPQAPRESFTLEADAEPPMFGGDYTGQEEADDYARPPQPQPAPRQQMRAWDSRQGPPPVRTVQKDEVGNPIVPGRQPRQQADDDEDGVPSV